MKPRTLSAVLFGMLVVLAGIIIYQAYRLASTANPAGASTRTAVVTNTVTQIAIRKINATNLLAALAHRPANWAALESTNYVVYIANLRAFGCPEDTVKDIILTDIARIYAKRRAGLRLQFQPRQYWQPEYSAPASNPKLQQELFALDREQRVLTRELLGVDFQTEFAKYSDDEEPAATYDFLSSEKRDQLLAIQAKFSEFEEALYARSQGLLLDEDEQQLNLLQQQRETELAALLTPEEMEEYQLRHSNIADNLRSQLSGFSPTEDEFRQLFRLHKQYDQQLNQPFDMTDDSQWEIRARAQEEAQQALEAEARKTLGSQRYAELQRAQDMEYRTLVQIAERYQLPSEVASQVYEMKQAAEQQKLELENNLALTEEQRQAGLAAVAQTTERAVAQAFKDPKVFKSYRKVAGQWLNALGEYQPPNVPPLPEEEPQ